MKHPKYAPHSVEDRVRASIAAVMTLTGEPNIALTEVLRVGDVMISRRRRGLAPWSIADLGRLAEHWQIPPGVMLDGPSETLDAMPPERIDELRALRKLPPLNSRPTADAA